MSEHKTPPESGRPEPRHHPEYREDEIDLRDLVRVLWGYRYLIVAVFAVAVFAAGIISFAMAPVYQVHMLVSLGNYDSTVYASQGSAREVIVSDDFIRDVVEDLGLVVPPEEFRAFRESIKVEPVTNTNMLRLTVETTDRAEGVAVLQGIFAHLQRRSAADYERHHALVTGQLETISASLAQVEESIEATRHLLGGIEAGGAAGIDRDFRRSQLLESAQAFEQQRLALLDRYLGLQRELNSLESARLIRTPREPVYPVKPNKTLNVALAGVLGLMLGVFAAFGIEFCRKNPLDGAGPGEG